MLLGRGSLGEGGSVCFPNGPVQLFESLSMREGHLGDRDVRCLHLAALAFI